MELDRAPSRWVSPRARPAPAVCRRGLGARAVESTLSNTLRGGLAAREQLTHERFPSLLLLAEPYWSDSKQQGSCGRH